MPGNFNISYLFNAIDRITPVAKRISRSFQTISNSVDKTTKNLRVFGSTLTKTGNKISSFGRSAFLKISAPIGLLIGTMIKSRAEMENTEIAFKTMLGSAKAATTLIAEIREMAIKTPFGERDLFRNSKLLLNFGVNAEKIIPSLTMLGDIAGGNKDRFNRLSLAFAQSSAQGRLMGQDLLQMVNAGFNPLQIISEKTGRSMGDLKDIMSKGGISFRMVSKAMKIATSEGGKFFKLMEEGSKTLAGRFSTLMDTIRIELKASGKILEPFSKAFVEKAIKLTEAFSRLNPETKKMILFLGIALAIIPPIIIGLGIMIKLIGFLSIGMAGLIVGIKGVGVALMFLALNPIGLFITSLMLLLTLSKTFRSDFVTVMTAGASAVKDFALATMKFLQPVIDALKFVGSALGASFEFVTGGIRNVLGGDNINDTVASSSSIQNIASTLGLEGTINIKGAPTGSTAEMSTFGNAKGNLGLNMSFAPGGI